MNIHKKQMEISFFGFAAGIAHFFLMIGSAIFTGSLVAWLDVAETVCDVVHEGTIVGATRKLRKNLKFEYNYGTDKLESISALFCDAIMLTSLALISVLAVRELIGFEEESGNVFSVLAIKVIFLVFNIVYVYRTKKIMLAHENPISEAAYDERRRMIFTDIIQTVILVISLAFREVHAMRFVSPILILAIVAYFAVHAVQNIRKKLVVLTDKTLPEETQLKILKVLNSCYDLFEGYGNIYSHYRGEIPVIEVTLEFATGTSYERIKNVEHEVADKMQSEIPECRVKFVSSEY